MRAAAALALLLAACGDDAPPDAGLCAVGDVSADPELELVYRTADGTMAPLAEGTVVPLLTPPQGGKVIYVGARGKNVDLCGASLQAALRDPCTDRVLGIERRPIAWRLADDGFAEPAQPQEISDYANLPLCPNAGSSEDLDGHPAQLEIRFYEPGGRVTERILSITPTCADDEVPMLCRCECDADYELGFECPGDPDGGVAECVDAGP
jgi:hypothetical protein